MDGRFMVVCFEEPIFDVDMLTDYMSGDGAGAPPPASEDAATLEADPADPDPADPDPAEADPAETDVPVDTAAGTPASAPKLLPVLLGATAPQVLGVVSFVLF